MRTRLVFSSIDRKPGSLSLLFRTHCMKEEASATCSMMEKCRYNSYETLREGNFVRICTLVTFIVQRPGQ